ncbi:DNA polymerase III subunit delta' [bacterium]|nr:DNA polymerase III subunit delta' [bacterium]
MARATKKAVKEEPSLAIPHPRRVRALYGHAGAVAAFEQAWSAGRLAHGWLITGPRGVGKATFAYHIARRVLAAQATDTVLPPEPDENHPISRRVAEQSHADLRVIAPTAEGGVVLDEKKKPSHDITIDQIRTLSDFMHLKAGEGAWRVVIVDPAENMNPSAANALLKMLEEPPPRVLMLLISHSPGQLLPTIRSRCRVLGLPPLSPLDAARVTDAYTGELNGDDHLLLHTLSEGSPGQALQLLNLDGLALYKSILDAMSKGMSEHATMQLAEKLAAKAEEDRWPLITNLARQLLHHVAMTAEGSTPPAMPAQEQASLTRIAARHSLSHWLHHYDDITRLLHQDGILHLDRRMLLSQLFSA